MGSPLQTVTENYNDSSNNTQYRYYILDSLGDIWVNDTALPSAGWFSIFPTLPVNMTAPPSGLGILNGWISYARTFANTTSISWVSTSMLGVQFDSVQNLLSPSFHATLSAGATSGGSQSILYYTDGNIVGSFFPNTGILTAGVNIQSYFQYTAVTTTGTITDLIGGTIPYISATTRVPGVFFTPGTLPSSITAGTIYYVQIPSPIGLSYQFNVYAAASGGSPLDMQTGATGNQYFNTFYPVSSGGYGTIVFSPENLYLPFYETGQSLARLGGTIIIGGKSNILYPWDGISPYTAGLIPLPENNVVNMITANNMLYVFAGQKGNIYICNGSSASLALIVPDYCAGIPGTPNSYIEPYFQWGGAMFLRGRVWFSILDQTATKAGNCGGIWSFVPTNNLYIGQDTGMALRLENQSSYGNYNGVCPVLIPSQNQLAIGAQYWSAWYSSISTPTYGIDFTDTIPQSCIIESDLIPTGTMLDKKTFKQAEYKVSTALLSGETVQLYYRQNSTDAYQALNAVNVETNALSGYFMANFQNTQWTQLKAVLTPLASTSSSFNRLTELRLR